MRCQVVTLAIFAAACLAGLSAATYTSPDFSYFVGSKSVAYWRSDCYDPSVDSDLQITGGWRMLVSAAFTPPNKVDLQFHGYLGVTCTSASAVDVTAAVTITGQDNSTLPSYIKWKYTLDKFIVNFQNALVRDRWRDAFATSSCNIDTFTPKDIAVSGCGDFLASQQNCPTRYIGFHTLSSSSMQFGYWFSQTNVQDGCSDPTIAANFTYAPYFQPSNGTTPPQLSLSMVTSNANPSFAKPGDSVTLTIVSDKTLLTAPFATLFGTEIQATQTAAKTYTASWTLGSSTPQTDVTQNVRVNNYADTDFNPGSQVLGCAGCLPITFDKTPPALSTWSYNVDGLSGEAGARFIFEGQALVVRIKAVDATYKSTSPTSVRVTVTNSSGTAFNYDATLVLVADDNTATFQWIAVGSVTGTVTVTVQNVFDPAGNSIEPVTADSGNSAAPLDLKLVAKYPLVSSIAIDASDYTKLVVTYSCTQAGTAYFSFVPDRRDSTTVSNFLNTYSTVSAFRSQTQYPVKEFPCLTTSQITEVTIVNGGAINQKSWYTVVYVSTSTGGDSPAPSVLLDVYTAAKYCFSADSTVALEDGSSRAMSQLQIGDRVLSFDEATGRTEYSDVAYIHKHAETAMFLRVSTRAGSQLTITPNHNIFRVSAENARELVKASELLVGDRVIVAGESGAEPAEIAKIDWTIEDKSFSPITLNGRMFVDGVLVSCYGANGETLGHLSHLPHRLLYRVAPSVLSSPSALRFQDAVVTAYHGLITAQVSH